VSGRIGWTEALLPIGVCSLLAFALVVAARRDEANYRVYVDSGAETTQHGCREVVERKGSLYCIHPRQHKQERFDTAHIVWIDTADIRRQEGK
jgi:hypothetical protein